MHWTVYVKWQGTTGKFTIPGRRCASTFVPEAGAQCVSSARWDLGGGRPEPFKGKGRPYRDRLVYESDPGTSAGSIKP